MKKRITKLTVPLEKAEKALKAFKSLSGANNFAGWLSNPTPENALRVVIQGYESDEWEYKVGCRVDAAGRIYTPSGVCLSISKKGLVVDFRRDSLVCAADVAASTAMEISGDDVIAYLEGSSSSAEIEDLLRELEAELTPAE